MEMPFAENHNPSSIRGLLKDLRGLGVTTVRACKCVGVPYSTMMDYRKCQKWKAPYSVQYALESLLAHHKSMMPKENVVKSRGRNKLSVELGS